MFKLGKKPAKHDPRTLRMEHYFYGNTPPAAPPQVDWGQKVLSWGMMGNDMCGDCTCAAAGHMIEAWSSDVGTEIVVPDSTIIAAYSAVSGYDPQSGANDNGAYCIDVLKYWRKVGIDDQKIDAFVSIKPTHPHHMMAACYLFGAYIGLGLPLSAQSQAVWDVPPEGKTGDGTPWSWGGHCVPIVAYDQASLTVVTWGYRQRMTWAFLSAYSDEAYAVLSPDWLSSANVAPNMFDLAQLKADLVKVTG